MNDEINRLRSGPRMSKIVRYGGMVFLSGQTSSGEPIRDIAGQTQEVLRRIDELLAEAGSSKDRLLSATVYLRDIADFDAMNVEWESWLFGFDAPARTTVEARLAKSDLLVEITVIACSLKASPGPVWRACLRRPSPEISITPVLIERISLKSCVWTGP